MLKYTDSKYIANCRARRIIWRESWKTFQTFLGRLRGKSWGARPGRRLQLQIKGNNNHHYYWNWWLAHRRVSGEKRVSVIYGQSSFLEIFQLERFFIFLLLLFIFRPERQWAWWLSSWPSNLCYDKSDWWCVTIKGNTMCRGSMELWRSVVIESPWEEKGEKLRHTDKISNIGL